MRMASGTEIFPMSWRAQALVMLYAALGILGLFLGDVMMTVLDPRIRLTRKGGGR